MKCFKCQEDVANLYYISGSKGWVTSSCSNKCKVRKSYLDESLIVGEGQEIPEEIQTEISIEEKMQEALLIAEQERIENQYEEEEPARHSPARREVESYNYSDEEEYEDGSEEWEDEEEDYESSTEVLSDVLDEFKVPSRTKSIILSNSQAQEHRDSYLHPEELRESITDMTNFKKPIINQLVKLYANKISIFFDFEDDKRKSRKSSSSYDRFSPTMRRREPEPENYTMQDLQSVLEKQAANFQQQLYEMDKRNLERELKDKEARLEEEQRRRYEAEQKYNAEIIKMLERRAEEATQKGYSSDEMRFRAEQQALFLKTFQESKLLDKWLMLQGVRTNPEIPLPTQQPARITVNPKKQNELNQTWDNATSTPRPKKKKKTSDVSVLDYLDE